MEQEAEAGGGGARSVLAALQNLSFHLSGAQVGITITSLIVGYLARPVLGRILEPVVEAVPGLGAVHATSLAIVLALAIATAFEMVVAELFPKNLAIARPEPVAYAVATALRWSNQLLKPLILLLNGSANWTVRLFGIEPRQELVPLHSIDHLESLIHSSREEGVLDEEDFWLLERSISFRDKVAADALVPRMSVIAIHEKDSLVDLAELALSKGHSRFPVIRRDLDDVVGVVHVRDIYKVPPHERSSTKVAKVSTPALVVPESRALASLLVEMRRQRRQLAIVLDEYGGTAGIVTMEDLVEEIVGDIEDEYDPASRDRVGEPIAGTHVVSGMLHRDEVAAATGFEIPDGDYETLAGFLLTLFDRIPGQGDQVAFRGWEFKVVRMEKRRIAEVLCVAPSHSPGAE